jgi:hypothetical protein
MTTTNGIDAGLSPRRRRMAQYRQSRRRPLSIVIAAALLFIISLVLLVGYYITFVVPPKHVVAHVNGVEFTLGDMDVIIKANAAFRAETGAQGGISTFPFQVLDNLVEGELINQVSPSLGLSVTDQEIENRLRENFYPTPPEGQKPSEEQLEREYREKYTRYLAIAQYSASTYREIIRGDLMRAKALETFENRVPSIEEHAFVEWIRIGQEGDRPLQTLEGIHEQLINGANFGVLAQQFSDDKRHADLKGVVGWVPRGAFPDLDETFFSIKPNTPSEPMFAGDGYYVIRITGNPETRQVSKEMSQLVKESIFKKWVDELRAANSVNVDFGSEEYDWLINKTREAVPEPTATPGLPGQQFQSPI